MTRALFCRFSNIPILSACQHILVGENLLRDPYWWASHKSCLDCWANHNFDLIRQPPTHSATSLLAMFWVARLDKMWVFLHFFWLAFSVPYCFSNVHASATPLLSVYPSLLFSFSLCLSPSSPFSHPSSLCLVAYYFIRFERVRSASSLMSRSTRWSCYPRISSNANEVVGASGAVGADRQWQWHAIVCIGQLWYALDK